MFVLLARANLAETLTATFKTAQYHLFLAAMLFRNIRNPENYRPPWSLKTVRKLHF
jgi:hypothetical protein